MCVSREMASCLDVASTTTVMVTKNIGRATEESRKVRTIFHYCHKLILADLHNLTLDVNM
jgi:hypothetical protein